MFLEVDFDAMPDIWNLGVLRGEAKKVKKGYCGVRAGLLVN